FSSRRRHTRFSRDWSSDVCSSDLDAGVFIVGKVPKWPQAQVDDQGEYQVTETTGHKGGHDGLVIFHGMFVVEDFQGEETAPQGRSEERRVGKECRAPHVAKQ